jgi:hypothetical protein
MIADRIVLGSALLFAEKLRFSATLFSKMRLRRYFHHRVAAEPQITEGALLKSRAFPQKERRSRKKTECAPARD